MSDDVEKAKRAEFLSAIIGFFLQGIGSLIGLIIGLAIASIILIIIVSFASKIFNHLSDNVIYACHIEKVDVTPEIFFINNDSDYGFVVTTNIKKTYRDGDVTVKIRLSSTEGDIEKRRNIYIKKDQTSVVQLQFPEPTINAQQVQAFVNCTTI